MLLPFDGWDASARLKKGVSTYYFYVEDYRFENIWQRPVRLIKSGCREIIEPNFSLYQTSPIAFGLQSIYKKGWLARWFQECGIRVWVDLNVAPKFREYNTLGVPAGYNAFATRGHKNKVCQLAEELGIARRISGMSAPNMIVYGGGEDAQSYCRQNTLVFIPEFMTDKRKEVKNG